MMRILDLFSGAGGAAMGYHRYWPEAEIIGVDSAPQKNYPFTFVQADAMEYPLDEFDFIHASPPCQHYANVTRWRGDQGDHPDLLPATLDRLRQLPIPWIVENVMGAPMPVHMVLCGTAFGLPIQRHRQFATSWRLFQLQPSCDHSKIFPFEHKNERAFADAMGCTWMSNREARNAIPPAYSEYLAQFVPVEAHR